MRVNPAADPATEVPPRLLDVVARRLSEDPAITSEVAEAVQGALRGDDSPRAPGQFDTAGVFLRAIRVRGFRGIGPEATLELTPGPGLTLVVGRNGSGKSSFAEAAELALTGGNRRWDGRSAAWREGWRNLHAGTTPRIELDLLTAGSEPERTIAKEWGPSADLSDAEWTERRGPTVNGHNDSDADNYGDSASTEADTSARADRPAHFDTAADAPPGTSSTRPGEAPPAPAAPRDEAAAARRDETAAAPRDETAAAPRDETAAAPNDETAAAPNDETDTAPFDVDRWAPVLDLYRPFLSYSELGALVDGRPSDLFDALHQLLGLDELTTAQERIRTRRLELERAARNSRQERLDLLANMEHLADERAVAMTALLRADRPDPTAVAKQLFGGNGGTTGPDGLRAIVRLALPTIGEVEEVATRLDTFGAAVARDTTADAEADLRVLDLLRRARAHVAATGTCSCPVCGRATLDEEWTRTADATITALAARVDALTTAQAELRRAVRDVRALPDQVPKELDFQPGAPPAVDTAAVRGAWSDWAALTGAEYTPDLAERLRCAHTRLVDQLEALQQGTRKELDRMDEVWSPLVPRIATWLDSAREVVVRAGELRTVRRAEEWLKSATAGLRGERMAPLETTARWVWRTLRQQSNVELGAITLQGNAGTARRVLLDVTVDEVDGAALGVMSQGELHALGLSLFLPRATVEQSPFRFVMIDDPVQAMDPAKVDGLATVLAAVAWNRQVIVFTHDERLAEAVRRMQLDASVLEVQRRERSVVEVRVSSDPVRRYLDDARSLVRTPQLPPAIADELVATCCRSAVEAAAQARARRDLLAAGRPHREVERYLEKAHTTRAMVALAVMGVRYNVDDLNSVLFPHGKWLVSALRDVTAGAHVPIGRTMRELISDTERFIAWLVR